MSEADFDVIGRATVSNLWLSLLSGQISYASAQQFATEMLTGFLDDGPIAEGIYPLHYLKSDVALSQLQETWTSWNKMMDQFEADPQGWRNNRSAAMISSLAEETGLLAARSFAERLTKAGYLEEAAAKVLMHKLGQDLGGPSF